MPNNSHPALQKALIFLTSNIQKKSWIDGSRLPTVAQLAQLADVSIATMSNAIGELKQKKIVEVRRNAGIFLGKAPAKKNCILTTPKPSKIQLLKKQISNDIIEGRLGESEFLPGYKELVHRYGTSFQTIKKITHELVVEKRIVPFKHGFKINLHTPPRSWRSIVFVQHARSLNTFNWKFFRTVFQMFINTLEKECLLRRIQLQGKIVTEHFESYNGLTQALGFILWPDFFLDQSLNMVIKELLPYNKPIIIINYNDQEYTLPKSRYIYQVTLSNQSAGERLGQYLLDTGHKKICYLSAFKSDWSQQRFKGLSRACSRLGSNVISISELYPPTTEEALNIVTPQDIEKINFLKNKLVLLKKDLKKIESSYPDPLSGDEIISKFHELIYITELQCAAVSLCRKALINNSATAWVCADDYLSVYGTLEFCTDNNILVPQNIAITGFNNMLETFRYNLTSYDFNMQAIVGRTLDTLLYPRKNTSSKENPEIEVEGFVVARGSTGKANLKFN